MKTITIPVIFNDGTKGTVIIGSKIYLSANLPNRVFYDTEKMYMHIDENEEKNHYGQEWQPTKDEYINAVKKLNMLYFADKLEINNPFFGLKSCYINKRPRNLRSIIKDMFFDTNFFTGSRHFRLSLNIDFYDYDKVEISEKMKCPPLGGSWQKYYKDTTWMAEAKKIKEGLIYLAK